jgi:hypothetical protein
MPNARHCARAQRILSAARGACGLRRCSEANAVVSLPQRQPAGGLRDQTHSLLRARRTPSTYAPAGAIQAMTDVWPYSPTASHNTGERNAAPDQPR